MKVNFPDKVFGRLASIADNKGVTIAELIVEAAHNTLGVEAAQVCPLEHVHPNSHIRGRRPLVDWRDPLVAARIRRLHGLHRSMAEVARVFGVGDSSMRTAYRHLGIIPTRSNTNPKEGN